MKMTVVQLIKLGREYLAFWPEKPELAHYFADYKAVQTSRFICRYFPAMTLFIFIMQLYLSSGYLSGQGSINAAFDVLPKALAYGLFLLTMPIHALVISGVKADKYLPPSLASWYRQGLEKAKQNEQLLMNNGNEFAHNKLTFKSISKLTVYKPRYIDLAQLLQITFCTVSAQNQPDK